MLHLIPNNQRLNALYILHCLFHEYVTIQSVSVQLHNSFSEYLYNKHLCFSGITCTGKVCIPEGEVWRAEERNTMKKHCECKINLVFASGNDLYVCL